MSTPKQTLALADQKRDIAVRRESYSYAPRVTAAWRALQLWFSTAPLNDAARAPIAPLALRTMTAFADLSDKHVGTLAQVDAWDNPGATRLVAEQKAAAIAASPALTEFYAEAARRNGESRAVQQHLIETRAAEWAAGAPQRLLDNLRDRNIRITLDKGRILVAANAGLCAADHEEIVQHKAALVGILAAEVEASRLEVVA